LHHHGTTTSRDVDRLRRLGTRAERERTGLCYAEGLGVVTQALRAGAEIERCVVAPPLLPAGAVALLAELRAAGVRIDELAPAAFAAISFKEGQHGIGAVVATRVEPSRRSRRPTSPGSRSAASATPATWAP
jgi:tRNA G18 (ribose-2'-O)-methylase SpoU